MPKDIDLGVLKRRDVREIWPNEARDFTPWLAQNLASMVDADAILEMARGEQ